MAEKADGSLYGPQEPTDINEVVEGEVLWASPDYMNEVFSRAEKCGELERQLAEAKATIERLRGLLSRLFEWDQLPLTEDGPYWIAEIDKALADCGEGEVDGK